MPAPLYKCRFGRVDRTSGGVRARGAGAERVYVVTSCAARGPVRPHRPVQWLQSSQRLSASAAAAKPRRVLFGATAHGHRTDDSSRCEPQQRACRWRGTRVFVIRTLLASRGLHERATNGLAIRLPWLTVPYAPSTLWSSTWYPTGRRIEGVQDQGNRCGAGECAGPDPLSRARSGPLRSCACGRTVQP